VFGGKAQWNGVADWLHVFLRGWAKLSSSRTTMEDRDWSNIYQENPTDISWNRTNLISAFKLLGETDYDFYVTSFSAYDLKAGILAGYQFLNMKWNSYGGPFWYDNGALVGIHPLSLRRYSYQQQFSIPYLGLQLNWLQKKLWGVRVFGKYTLVASARDQDFHVVSEIFFIDKYGNGHWWSAGTEIYWYFWKWLGLNLTYTYEQLNTTTGSAFSIPASSGGHIYSNQGHSYVPQGAGIFYSQQEFTLGLRGSF
jgi:outer membrane protease